MKPDASDASVRELARRVPAYRLGSELEAAQRFEAPAPVSATAGRLGRDLCIFPLGDYDAAHPSEGHLIIEVSDSSLAYDRDEKARLYAACRVPEYWIVNLIDRVVEGHRRPDASRYCEVTASPPRLRPLSRSPIRRVTTRGHAHTPRAPSSGNST